ncbi:MAG TPA: hypothetical protein VFP41_07425 [Actinomycetota bacterium]|nr:hypothetical protein [Actinomycetota bacterium]
MDASRTHEQTQGQAIWLFVAIGVVVFLIATLSVGVATNADDVGIKQPAIESDAGAATRMPATRGFEVGRGGLNFEAATAVREGGHYAGAIPIGTPDSFTDVRESGAYYGAGDVTPGLTPGHGSCPVKQQCV